MTLSRLTAVAAATLAAACACSASAHAASKACGQAGYSYAGVQSTSPARGISASLSLLRTAQVTSGHVAAWVGVGGPGQGANGADEWLQAGIASIQGGATELYYELALPGQRPAYTSIRPVSTGESHTVAVVETAMPGYWVVVVDWQPVTQPIYLPGSHGAWAPMATSESYDGGYTTCNAYAFQFSDLKVDAATGIWSPLDRVRSFADSGHTLRSLAGAIVVNRG
jgi:hypothetical protein